MKVLITTGSFAGFDKRPLDMLTDNGYEVIMNPFKRKITKDEALKLYQGIDGVIAGTEFIDSKVMGSAVNLKVISRCGAGLDNVDLSYAKDKGIKVFNTPDAATDPVAELTLGLILSLLRQIPFSDRSLRLGVWEKQMGRLLAKKIVGIIGFGRIGRRLAELLKGFGVKIVYNDPFMQSLDKEYATFEALSLTELLKNSDIVTLHLSYSKANSSLIGEKELALMKETAFLLNISRGGIIDEEALYAALKTKKISGAALDVFENEPYNGKLKELDNVILTPHVGSYALEARIEMEIAAAKNLILGLEGKAL
ncbi:MAG: phosphoglycerate dehydrogenase [Candidatus Omnitrophica bacterium]|nr:phosphoglycerate dehydrogenase [Candidatus Omnitrophota bacterium]